MNTHSPITSIIDEKQIFSTLSAKPGFDKNRFEEILQKASEAKGLNSQDVAFLLLMEDREALDRLIDSAMQVKEEIYGRRLVLFAPLYTSNYCTNECLYCGFRQNSHFKRHRLSLDEIKEETRTIINMGHKRILMVAGEDQHLKAEDIRDQVQTIYSVKLPKGNIRRVNVNVAPQSVEQFKIIQTAGLGTYQCFQETYHRETYKTMHPKGQKSDYDFRITVFDRCIQAGINDFGTGFLFGLYDYRFETLALLQHIAYLEKTFGIGPHTISIPRLEPADGTDILETTRWRVTDDQLIKVTAILRLAVPYTGIILSTRESPVMRERLLGVGVSQLSAGSITNPGGYKDSEKNTPSLKVAAITSLKAAPKEKKEENAPAPKSTAQFEVQDHRSLDEVIREACKAHFIPSFCTGCYRQGRTGEIFQHMAKDHHIGPLCTINAVTTLQEYLDDYATPETRAAGQKCIQEFMETLHDPDLKKQIEEGLKNVKSGCRDQLI